MLGEGTDEQESKTTDPRAYPNKSVSARMAIISAGVIMNVFLAVACFVYYYGQERLEATGSAGRRHGRVSGLRSRPAPGDEVVAIDDRRNLDYLGLIEKVLFELAGTGAPLRGETTRSRRTDRHRHPAPPRSHRRPPHDRRARRSKPGDRRFRATTPEW